MKKKYLFIVAAVILTIVPQSLAGETLKMGFGNALPPFVIPKTNEGILIDMIKETLEPEGYAVKPFYFPYARRLEAYKKGKVDVVCDVKPHMMTEKKLGLEGSLSDIAYAYENIAISLKKNGYKFSKISDLAEYSLLSWQGAKVMLGGEYAEMADKNKRYREVADQKTQVKMLFMGREDVIQMDRLIFSYFRNRAAQEGKIDVSQPIDIFPLFGKSENGFLFRDKNVQTLFNRNFRKLKESGKYDQIVDKYTKK